LRVDRFRVLFFAFVLTALVAVLRGPTPVAVTSSSVPAEPCLTEAVGEIPTIDVHAVVAVDATTQTGGKPWAVGASQSVAYPAPSRTHCPLLGAHADRSPPPA
jgi:hypothetical protein